MKKFAWLVCLFLVCSFFVRGEEMKVKLVGIQCISGFESDDNLPIFNKNGNGMYLFFKGELPEDNASISNFEIEKAIDSTGKDLTMININMIKTMSSYNNGMPNVLYGANDNNVFGFETLLTPPAKDANSIKELSGTVNYEVPSELKEVDLGFTEISEGAEGKEYEAVIKNVNSYGEGKNKITNFSIEMIVPANNFKKIKVLNEDGKNVAMEQYNNGRAYRGYNRGVKKQYYSVGIKEEIPKKFKIIAEVYKKSDKKSMKFKLENISLMLGGK